MTADEEEEAEAVNEALSEMLENEGTMQNFEFPSFRDQSGFLSYESTMIRSLGTHKCGSNFCVPTGIDFSSAPNVARIPC